MADIRCPMCGKTNSADNETCQYCQARLKPLINGPLIEPEKPSSPQADSGDVDWLSDLRSDESAEPGFGPSDSLNLPSDFGDWLSRLDKPDGAESGQPSDMLFRSEQEELPDWLKNTAETPASLPSEEQAPDWLNNLAEPAASLPNEEQAPDWLNNLAEPAASLPSEEQAPDWMQEIQPQASEESVDWLQELEPQDTEKAAPDAGNPFETSEPQDWMATLANLSSPSEGKPETAEPAEQLPDWIKPESEAENFQQAPSVHHSILDWTRELTSPPEAETPLTSEIKEHKEEPGQEALTEPITEAGEMPDWLTDLGTPSEGKAPGTIAAFVLSDEDLSPYVSGDEMAASDQVPGELESLPEWLSQVPFDAPESALETPPPSPEIFISGAISQTDADLAPAELPTWLEAMRPVEMVAPTPPSPEDSSASPETMGPLAGLRGVLPVEAEIARIRKPPAYTVKLPISEAHQARVSLIEEMVATEGLPKPVAPYVAIVPQTILRLAIALFLILSVMGVLWIGQKTTPLPDPKDIPQEVNNLYGQVEALSSQSPVLVAFDYEPGFSGEMEAAASQVLYHLISKRVPLVLVSTNPFGLALAERVVNDQMDFLNSHLPAATFPYTSTQFTYLGYIPGGITGLRAFAETPAKVLPRSFDQVEVWSAAPLSPSATLASFQLTLVVTDDPDTAQAWIEQAQPIIEPSPLLMILSAQAVPMIRPYYDSDQVQGLVAGLAGGAAYENLFLENERVDVASKSWDAFSASLLVATILILIGSLVNASLASLAQNKHKGEEHPYA